MRLLAWILCVLLAAVAASAQESSAQLVLEVRAQRVSQAELEAALRAELNKGASAEVPQGQLALTDSAANVVRLTFRDGSGRESTRDLYLAPDDPEALEKITLAAANLVRDQAAALLAELEARELAAAAAAAPAAAAAAPTPPVLPPPAFAAAPPKPPAYDPCNPRETVAFGADLVPMVGSSSIPVGRTSARHFSLGVFGTYSAGVHGFEISTAINIDRRGACGVQLAAGANITLGPVKGLQLALFNLAAGWQSGVQLGLANYVGNDGHGLQLAIANALVGRLRGAQVGVGNFARKGVGGGQVGVVNLAFGETSGQAGVINVARHQNRAQLGVFNLSLGSSITQLGVIQVATRDTKAQIGVININGNDAKAQVGVINYARTSTASIGVLNIVPRGHTSVDALVSENGTLLAGITHGGNYVRNTYAAGARFNNGTQNVLAIGLGVRLFTHRRANLDLDLLHEFYLDYEGWVIRAQDDRLKLSTTVWVHERVGVVGSAGYALMYSDRPEIDSGAPFGQSVFNKPDADGQGALYGFPSLSLGVRVMLTDPKRPER